MFQVSKKYVSKELAKEIHAKAEPFVKWLKEAEEESEGSDEEDKEDGDNVEVIAGLYSLNVLKYSFIHNVSSCSAHAPMFSISSPGGVFLLCT